MRGRFIHLYCWWLTRIVSSTQLPLAWNEMKANVMSTFNVELNWDQMVQHFVKHEETHAYKKVTVRFDTKWFRYKFMQLRCK